jgi:hypothetical protein
MMAYAYRYNDLIIEIATKRGYDDKAHRKALEDRDEDAISLTHPYNWLTGEEVEEEAE